MTTPAAARRFVRAVNGVVRVEVIVNGLASAWGLERTGSGKTVWFELSPPSDHRVD